MAKTKKITIGDLAIMVKHGFNEMDSWFDLMEKNFGADIADLKQGQERIDMSLQNVVYRTELDAVLERVVIL